VEEGIVQMDPTIRKQVIQATLSGTALNEFKKGIFNQKRADHMSIESSITSAVNSTSTNSERVVSYSKTCCPSCGNSITEGSKFCSSCGEKVDFPVLENNMASVQESGRSPLRRGPERSEGGSSLNSALVQVLQNKEKVHDLSESEKSSLRKEVIDEIDTSLVGRIMSGVYK